MGRVSIRSLVLLLLPAGAFPVLAGSGGIAVRVTDVAGEPLAGAMVTLSNTQQLVPKATVATDAEGRAEFPILSSGTGYVLEVYFPGYARQRIADLRVRIGTREDLPVKLTAEIRETVEVTAGRDVVDLERTASVTKFNDEFIADLPVQGRFYQNVLTMAPGVTDPDGDGNPNVHGGRSRDFKALVSGVSNVDPLTGEWMSYVNPDSIEEMEVITSGAGVEFGRAQGGFAQIVQKQGSNDFEGVVGFLYGSSRLDHDGAADVSRDQRPEFEWLQPWIQVSGPILRDRLWYRVSLEWIDREDPINVGTGVAVTGQTQSIHSSQLTWQATPRNKLFLQYDYDPKALTNVGITSRIPAESSQRHEFGGPTFGLGWTASVSPRLLVDSGIAYQDHEVNVLPSTVGVLNNCEINDVYPSLNEAQCFWTNRNQVTGSYFTTSRDTRQRLTVRSQAEWYAGKFLGGTHHLKFGTIVENEHYSRSLDARPDVNFHVIKARLGPPLGVSVYRIPVPHGSSARVTGNNWGIYVEDQMRVRSNLTLTVGLRLDREELDSRGWEQFFPEQELQQVLARMASGATALAAVPDVFTAHENVAAIWEALADTLDIGPSEARGLLDTTSVQSAFWDHQRRPASIAIRNTNLAPRLAVSWDPWANGKTKLSLSAGRYYDKIFLAVPLIEVEPATTFMTFYSEPVRVGPDRGRFATISGAGIPATINVRTVDPGLRTPYQDEVALGFEREVSPETSLRVSFLKRKYRDQLQDVDMNHVPTDYGRCIYSSRSGWRVDASHGPDGRVDDCARGGDGVPDLYIQNPGWGEILMVGNFNTTRYEAAVVELVRRLYRSWQLEASYTWSKARGDAEDFNQFLGNDRNTVEDERGFLAYDQRHVFKVFCTTVAPGGIRVGGGARYESGLPFSFLTTYTSAFAITPINIGTTEFRDVLTYPTGQRNDQRNPSSWIFDARVAKEWALARGGSASAGVDVFNLMNDDEIRIFDFTDGAPEYVRRFGRRYQIGFRLAF